MASPGRHPHTSSRAVHESHETQPLLIQRNNNMASPKASTDGEIIKGDIVIGAVGGDEARIGVENEHNLTFTEALKAYPAAVGWSIFFSLGIIMTAFDPQLLGNLYATPAFQKDFGYLFEGEYIVSAPWQTGLSMGNPIGQVVGALFAAYPMEW